MTANDTSELLRTCERARRRARARPAARARVGAGRRRLDPATGAGRCPRGRRATSRRASAAADDRDRRVPRGATRGCDRASACGCGAAWPANRPRARATDRRRRSARLGDARPRTHDSRLVCRSGRRAHRRPRQRTLSPLTVGRGRRIGDGRARRCGSGRARPPPGSARPGTDGAATAAAGAEGTLGAAGAAAGGRRRSGRDRCRHRAQPERRRARAGTRAGRGSPAPRRRRGCPRWTYGPATSASPLGPTVPTAWPSSTAAPGDDRDRAEVRQRDGEPVGGRDRERRGPSPGRCPLNVTVPAAGATHHLARRRARCRSRGARRRRTGAPGRRRTAGGRDRRPATSRHAPPARRAARPETATSSTRRIDITSVVRSENGRSRVGATVAVLSNEITKLSQSAAVEVVARDAAQPRDDLGRDAARRAGRDELPDRGERTVDVERARHRARRRASPLPSAARRSAPRARRRHRARPPRTASSARGTRRPRARDRTRRASASDAPTRCGDSNATTAQPQDDVSRQSASSSPALRGRKPTNAYGPPPRPLATSAVSTADAPGSTVTGTRASSAARTRRAPGSETSGIPASVTSAMRSPASSRGRSSATRAASLCSW